MYGISPAPGEIQAFVSLQNADGGYPCGMARGKPSAVHKTLTALHWLDELGLLESAAAAEAVGYLLRVQRQDGGWDEDPALISCELPAWIRPGEPQTRAYLSAYAAYWLAVMDHKTDPAFKAALSYLLAHPEFTGGLAGYRYSTWIAASVFWMAGYAWAEQARKAIAALQATSLAEWEDSEIAWALECLGRAGVPQGQPFVHACLEELAQRAVAGGWRSEGGAAGDTIAILKALKQYAMLGDSSALHQETI